MFIRVPSITFYRQLLYPSPFHLYRFPCEKMSQNRLVGLEKMAGAHGQPSMHSQTSMEDIQNAAIAFMRKRIELAMQLAAADNRKTVTADDIKVVCANIVTTAGFS
jgi:histone H3/H4